MTQLREELPAPGLTRSREAGSHQQSEVREQTSEITAHPSFVRSSGINIALLTGGGDKPYALGMADAVTAVGIEVDFIGSDDLSAPELLNNRRVNFYNLRGDQRAEASRPAKVLRVLSYYVKLIAYAATAKPKLFHILWNNKLELFDRTILMLYYKLLRKRVVFTAHNVNKGKRDENDSWLNRVTLKIQYSLCDHIFVHTNGMKRDMVSEFRIPERKVSVIPFGINKTIPNTSLSSAQAKRHLGLTRDDKTLLFFGNIAPYKGLEYLVTAFTVLLKRDQSYRLLIVGRPKGQMDYWKGVERTIMNSETGGHVIARIEYVPDEETELYFKAADVLVLPYTRIFQSGVLFLGYSFGLPTIAADVGSLKEEIIEGTTGFVFRPQDSSDLVRTIEKYFDSQLFRDLEKRRTQIVTYANDEHSWSKVAAIIKDTYSRLLTSTF